MPVKYYIDSIIDKRLDEYQYFNQLKSYMDTAPRQKIALAPNMQFSDSFIYPKQLEIHLPSNRDIPCNLHCSHCFGTLYKKDLGQWEAAGLKLIHNLKGAIPYQIYGGAYTEPLLSPFLFPYLAATKQYGNHFGIHTNGTMLTSLNETSNFFENLNEISTDSTDYISISLDAGSGRSWKALKKGKQKSFWDIIYALEQMSNMRDRKGKDSHAIRLTYLVSDETCSREEFEFIVSLAKMLKLDSVRFSIPYGWYNQDFDTVKQYKESVETRLDKVVEDYTRDLVSESTSETPYIFWNPPWFTDIDRFTFQKCYYGYFQITLAADGYVYRCSAVAAPTAKHLRLGEITSDLDEFHRQIYAVQNISFDCQKMCFDKGLRCNRMGLEINTAMELEEARK